MNKLVAVIAVSAAVLIGCGGDKPSGDVYTDSRDGKTYKITKVGVQTWMAENLNYDIAGDTMDACYGGDANNCAKYGRMYKWEAAQKACPVGFHVPSDAEWTALTDYIGGTAIGATVLKSTAGWESGGNGTDEYGFSATPGGYGSVGDFGGIGEDGCWWSATEHRANGGWLRCLSCVYEGVGIGGERTEERLAYVRCVRDEDVYTVAFSANGGSGAVASKTAGGGSGMTLPSGNALTRDGYLFAGWNTDSLGTGANYGAGSLLTVTGDVTLYAKWNVGGVSPLAPFTDARDGRSYKRAKIGGQIWMAENLHYDVPDDTTDVCYENSADSCAKYGRMYKWEAAQKVCPTGFHLPSDEEWTALTDYIGGTATAGTKLRTPTGWQAGGNGTDEYGFSAMSGGYVIGDGGFSGAGGSDGCWWSGTESGKSDAWLRCMCCIYEGFGRGYYGKSDMFSVRCVQDVE